MRSIPTKEIYNTDDYYKGWRKDTNYEQYIDFVDSCLEADAQDTRYGPLLELEFDNIKETFGTIEYIQKRREVEIVFNVKHNIRPRSEILRWHREKVTLKA